MGPGYFPLVLAGVLGILGLAIIAKGVTAAASESDLGPIPWRERRPSRRRAPLLRSDDQGPRPRPQRLRGGASQRARQPAERRGAGVRHRRRADASLLRRVPPRPRDLGPGDRALGSFLRWTSSRTSPSASRPRSPRSTCSTASLACFSAPWSASSRHRPDRDDRDAAPHHLLLRAGDRAHHARRHLLRRPVRRLDHRDPHQPPRRELIGRHRHRRLPDGQEGTGGTGPCHRRARLVLRGHGRDADPRPRRAAARPRRPELRPSGVLLAHRARPRRLDRACARLDPQGARHDRPRAPARHGRPGHLHRHPALHLRLLRALLRDQFRLRRRRHLRRRRDPQEPRERDDPGRDDQARLEPLAQPRAVPPHRRPGAARHRPRLGPRRAAGRGARPLLLRLLLDGEAPGADPRSSARARSRASPAPRAPTTPRRRPPSFRSSPSASPPTR